MKVLIYGGVSERVQCPECRENMGDQAEVLKDGGVVARPCWSCGWKGRWRYTRDIEARSAPRYGKQSTWYKLDGHDKMTRGKH